MTVTDQTTIWLDRQSLPLRRELRNGQRSLLDKLKAKYKPPSRRILKQLLLADRQQTELPPDYIELEKRVDALKQVHQKLLQVT